MPTINDLQSWQWFSLLVFASGSGVMWARFFGHLIKWWVCSLTPRRSC